MARKGSKHRKAAKVKRWRKELDDLIGRHVVEQVLAGAKSAGEAIVAAGLHETMGGRALHLIDLLKKSQKS